MSLSVTLNYCQKICISFPIASCVITPITWVSLNTNIATVYYNQNSAIIKATFGGLGIANIVVSDATGVIFTVYVSVFAYVPPVVVNPKYQYVSTFNVSGTINTSSNATVVGPFNSLVVPTQPNLCMIAMIQNANATNSAIISTFFNPSTASTLTLRGQFLPAAATLNVGIGVFQPTVNTTIDHYLIFSSTFTVVTPLNSSVINGTTYYLYQYAVQSYAFCGDDNYISFVQPISNIVTGIQPNLVSSNVSLNSILSFQSTVATNVLASAIIVPKSYYNTSSTSLVYSKIVSVSLVGSGVVTVTIDTIPTGTVMWFAQQYNTDNVAIANVLSVEHTSSTTLDIKFILNPPSTPVTRNVSIIAYKLQSNAGYSLTFP